MGVGIVLTKTETTPVVVFVPVRKENSGFKVKYFPSKLSHYNGEKHFQSVGHNSFLARCFLLGNVNIHKVKYTMWDQTCVLTDFIPQSSQLQQNH